MTHPTITWAHLSDFHFRGRPDFGVDEVKLALIDDLRIFACRSPPARGAVNLGLDVIFVTGDIAFGGGEDEYKEALAFFERLSDATGVPRERIFPIPGNHDGNLKKDAPSYMRTGIRGRTVFSEHWASETGRPAFQPKLAAYREFAARLNPSLAAMGPLIDVGGYARTIVLGDKALGIAALGSSWLGQGGDEDRGKLITGKEQLYEVAGGVELPRLKGADLTIALMHHPLDWMQEFDQAELEPILADSAQLLLRGHLHRTGLGLQVSPGHKLVTVAAGASYESSTWRNAYNVGRVTFTPQGRQLEVWLRAYSPGERRFVKDVETYAATEDGYWNWDLDEPRTQPIPVPPPVDVTRYLRWLDAEHRWIKHQRMGGTRPLQLELTHVYTRLRASAVGGPPTAAARARGRKNAGAHSPQALLADDGRPREYDLRDVLAETTDAVLVGDPGSGKSTFLSFVAVNLARALLDEDQATALSRIGLGSVSPIPFPILVRLVDFGSFLASAPAPSLPADAAEHFYRYLDQAQDADRVGLPSSYLRDRCSSGGCMLLLDGLDEVPGERLRERVGRIVEHVINTGRSVGNRHLVTSRTRAYVGPVQLGDGIARFDLAEFGPEEVAEFVRRWSLSIHGLRPDGSGDPTELALAEEDQQRLAEAVAANPNVRPLTTSPLLLTMLAVLYRNEKRLPDQRAELYDVAIKYLLESRPGHSPYSAVQRRQAYEALALGMFVGQKKGPRRTIDRSQAAKWVAPFLVGSKAPDAQSIALAFLDDEEKSSGIIVSRTHGQVEFWHLTFQEYLAALGLSRASQHKKLLGARAKGGYWPILKPVLHDDRWAEVVLLLAGCLRHEGVDGASDLIRSIVDHDPSLTGRARAVGLTGRILRDIKPYGGSPEEGTGYAEALDEVLDLFKPGAKSTPESVRIEVGEALGASGDPRLADENANEVWIGGATFLMGAQARSRKRPRFDPDARDDECPTHFVTVSGFWIDRYPVTVGQYAHFVESGGYRNDPCWTPAGREWRDSRSRTDPDDWVGQLEHTNRPVVNVTWFEADAYAAWAGKRLPTESEWELAARGRNGRRFPWGDDRPAEHHASFDGRTSSPTPVGIYPRGATRWGVFDLAGNILEWCSDWYGTYPSKLVADPLGVSQGYARVTRGGAFYFDVLALRAACRRSYGPGFANDFLGFRCVRSSPGGHSEL